MSVVRLVYGPGAAGGARDGNAGVMRFAQPHRRLVLAAALLALFSVLTAQSCSGTGKQEPQVKKQGGAEGDAETAEVGDKLTLTGTTYQVTNVDTANEVGDRYTGATANGEFVIVDLNLTNEEEEPATILEDNLRLIGGNGNQYTTSSDAILAFPDQTILLEEIQPDNTQKGVLVYDLPPDAVSGAKLQVEDLFTGSTGEIDLGL